MSKIKRLEVISFMNFEILTTTNMTITLSLVLTPCYFMERSWRFWRNVLCTFMAEKGFKDANIWFLRNVCRFVRLSLRGQKEKKYIKLLNFFFFCFLHIPLKRQNMLQYLAVNLWVLYRKWPCLYYSNFFMAYHDATC